MKNNKVIASFVIVIVVALIILFSSKSKVNDQNTESIKIGAVLSLTGDASPWGEYGKDGIDLAVKKINESGGINGRKIEVSIEDDHTDPKQSVSAFNKLVSVDHVQGIVGGVFDFTAQPLIPLAQNQNIAYISPSNFRIARGFDLNDQSFVMLTDFNKTIEKLSPYISKNQINKMAVIHFKSTFGNEIAKTIDLMMTSLGRSHIVDESYAQIGNNDFKTTVIKLKQQNVDAVFLDMVANDPINFLRQAKQLDFKPRVITYNGTLDSFSNESDKSLLNGVIILNWEIVSDQFSEMFQKEYSKQATKSVDKYFDSIYVMAQSIANSSKTSEVNQYIIDNTFTTPNSTISFTQDHAVKDINVRIQIMKDGVLKDW